MNEDFDSITIAMLDGGSDAWRDTLRFGVIGFAHDGLVCVYNAFESNGAGLSRARVSGRHVFDEVAPCMNNFMVVQRFEDADELDETLPYVLTLRMRPTPVRLRLLKSPRCATRFVLIDRSRPA